MQVIQPTDGRHRFKGRLTIAEFNKAVESDGGFECVRTRQRDLSRSPVSQLLRSLLQIDSLWPSGWPTTGCLGIVGGLTRGYLRSWASWSEGMGRSVGPFRCLSAAQDSDISISSRTSARRGAVASFPKCADRYRKARGPRLQQAYWTIMMMMQFLHQ